MTKNSASYWEGKSDAESLQRVYGISFPDPKMLKEWKHFQEEAAKRDHRKIGEWCERGREMGSWWAEKCYEVLLDDRGNILENLYWSKELESQR